MGLPDKEKRDRQTWSNYTGHSCAPPRFLFCGLSLTLVYQVTQREKRENKIKLLMTSFSLARIVACACVIVDLFSNLMDLGPPLAYFVE